jgi:drug/metabolite transporter (DMT)-like permease
MFTVIAGMLCAPFIYRDARRRVPRAALAIGVAIFAGVLMMQLGHAQGPLDRAGWIALACVLGSALLYPLGNRMLLLHLETSPHRVGAVQRVFGMTLCTLPIWIVFAAITWITIGPPTPREILLGGGVALFSGTIATVLFYAATDMVHARPAALAAVEAMQSAELLFATLLGVLLIGEAWPQGWSALGSVAIVAGIALSGWSSDRDSPKAMAAEPRTP